MKLALLILSWLLLCYGLVVVTLTLSTKEGFSFLVIEEKELTQAETLAMGFSVSENKIYFRKIQTVKVFNRHGLWFTLTDKQVANELMCRTLS